MKKRHSKKYCLCAECIQCGCGEWWRHHGRLGHIKSAGKRSKKSTRFIRIPI